MPGEIADRSRNGGDIGHPPGAQIAGNEGVDLRVRFNGDDPLAALRESCHLGAEQAEMRAAIDQIELAERLIGQCGEAVGRGAVVVIQRAKAPRLLLRQRGGDGGAVEREMRRAV